MRIRSNLRSNSCLSHAAVVELIHLAAEARPDNNYRCEKLPGGLKKSLMVIVNRGQREVILETHPVMLRPQA